MSFIFLQWNVQTKSCLKVNDMCTCQTRSLSGLGLLMWAGYHSEPSSILLPVLFDPKKIYTTFSWLNRGIKKREEEIPGEKSSHFILPGYVQFRYPLNDCIARITFKDKSNTQNYAYAIHFLNIRFCKLNSLDGESHWRLQKILKRVRKTSKLFQYWSNLFRLYACQTHARRHATPMNWKYRGLFLFPFFSFSGQLA